MDAKAGVELDPAGPPDTDDPAKKSQSAQAKMAKETKKAKGAKQEKQLTAFNKPKTGKERWKARKMSHSKSAPEALHTSHIPWLGSSDTIR